MLSFGFILAILIELLLPFGLAIWFTRKFGTSWKLFGVGVLTFIASQLVHLPLLYGLNALTPGISSAMPAAAFAVLNAVLLGLAAGLCEETARWVGFKLLKSRARKFGSALTVGAGHGGVESIFIGVMLLINYSLFMIISNGKGTQFGIPVEMQYSMAQQMYAYLSMPWWLPLVGAVERIFAVTLHLALSVMVWQAFKNRSWGWFIGAVLWHAFVDAAAVLMSTYNFNIWLLEGVIGVMAAANAVFVVWFGRKQLEMEAEEGEEGNVIEGEIVEGESPEDEGIPLAEESVPIESEKTESSTGEDEEKGMEESGAGIVDETFADQTKPAKKRKSLFDDDEANGKG